MHSWDFKDVRANCFCASLLRMTARTNSHATSCIERARQVIKWTMVGQMAIAIALLRFNNLGRSVTPTCLFTNRFYLQLSPHCSKTNKKINVGSKKNFKISVHGTWNPAIREVKHDVYCRRQTAKITCDFLFFSCNS